MNRASVTHTAGAFKGKVTIAGSPVKSDESGKIWLYRNLVSGLLFSDGFNIDLAWLRMLTTHLRNEVSSIRHLFVKGYVTIVSRIPRETGITELDNDIQDFVRHLDVWDWPASFDHPDPRPVSSDSEFLEYPLRERKETLVYREWALATKLDVKEWFKEASPDLTTINPPDFVWRAMQGIKLSGKLFTKRRSALDQALITTTVSRIDELLAGPQMCSVLGRADEAEQKRLACCTEMLLELSRSAGCISAATFHRLQELAATSAELVGLSISTDSRDEEIGVSIRGVIGYLLAVQQVR